MEERTGKSLIALMLAESSTASNILILTKKKALPGWQEHLDQYPVTKQYTLTNYHQVVHLKPSYDMVIFDECHYVLSGFPKAGKYQKATKAIAHNAQGIYLSATFSAQSFSQLYHIFDTTKHTPWPGHKNFYAWVKAAYVYPYTIDISGRQVTRYDRAAPKVFNEAQHLFLSYTRKELGFTHEPEDVLHYIDLEPAPLKHMKELKADGITKDKTIVADTQMGLMVALHKLEGVGNEKTQYILDHYGDKASVCVMAHYVDEQERLAKLFVHATVLSSTAFAEGVDLSHFETLVIFSQGFSTAQHKQRRARQANINRATPINVHFLLVKGGVSDSVYKTVALNGKNFVARYYD